MVRVGLYLSEIQMKRARNIAKKRGLTVSEIIRRMIDEGLERYEKGRGKG
jgi:hypothetical protein